MVEPETDLLPRLAGFARLLHDVGLRAGQDRLTSAVRALAEIEISDPAAFRDALRACFVSAREEAWLFEAAFDLYWLADSHDGQPAPPASRMRNLPLSPERARAWLEELGLRAPVSELERPAPPSQWTYSERELLRHKDFDELSYEESEQVRRLLQQAPWRVAQRRGRRRRPAPHGELDLERSSRASIRSGGELLRVLHRRARVQQRPLVLICDVSGSMAGYTRMLLIFAHAIARRQRVESFVFSTRLTRITRNLKLRDVDQVLTDIGRSVHDFSGGTRIGAALGDFNRRWSRRVLGHGAICVIVSDGWDRGEPERLEQELRRLRRSCHRLIWLNPLLGSKGYEPLTRGMAAALPHTDDFLAAHNLRALDELGRLLGSLGGRR